MESLTMTLKPATLIFLLALSGKALAEEGKQPAIERCECQGANIGLRVFAPSNKGPGKIAALGTSAGAHLAAAAAIFDEPWGSDVSASPDVLILRSPAISVADSSWFKKISGGALNPNCSASA